MGISYRKLWIRLAEREISKQEFREQMGIAPGTMTKLNKGQEVALPVLIRICEYLGCDIGDICEVVSKK
ncbi:MAG: helix-turn-helix transcriptional regulator [Eubacterium sp.]|nr:helix-turn-helix transcriptional regulator [Eubacterium sp.]